MRRAPLPAHDFGLEAMSSARTLQLVLIKVLHTPSDFEVTMGTEDFVLQKWVSPPVHLEADVRGTINEIFEDLQYIGSADPGRTAAYLDGISEPLERLRKHGLQLLRVVTSGKITMPVAAFGSEAETTMPWRRSIYVVA